MYSVLSLPNVFVDHFSTVKRVWNRKSRSKITNLVSTDKGFAYPQWERDYLLSEEPEFRMFEEYLEMGEQT